MAETRTTDISAFDKPDGELPDGRGGRLARFLGQIVSAASTLPCGEFQISPLRCRRRPNRRRCEGRIELGRDDGTDAVGWRCPICGDSGVITNWRHTRWDLGPELEQGHVVSLSLARARRAGRKGNQAQLAQVELMVELIDGPLPLSHAVTRKLRISADKSLEEVHLLLCRAYERHAEGSYEFLFGAPYERGARRYSGIGCPDQSELDTELADETRQMIVGELGLRSGQAFGYLYDFDTEWIHRLTVLSSQTGPSCAEVIEAVGEAPSLAEVDQWVDSLVLDEDGFDDDGLGAEIYLPDEAPEPESWLAMQDVERVLLIIEAHGDLIDSGFDQMVVHAMLHEIADTALARREARVKLLFNRSRAAGCDRHEALHRVGRTLLKELL